MWPGLQEVALRGKGFRRLRRGVLAGTCSGALALTSVLTASSAFGDDTAVIMGGSGMPIPIPEFVQAVNELYLHCDPPACSTNPLTTPEGLYPLIVGPRALTFDESVAQGVSILNNEIQRQLAEGDHVTVLGYSQSATIASFEMANLADGSAGIDADPDQLSFVLLGDPSNPNGGLLTRADILPGSDPTIPSLGITFGGATPVTDYPTAIYTAEYDGFADFPRYPLNLLADLNALLGIVFVHGKYPILTDLSSAVEVPTSAGYDGATTYYMIPTENLPLLDPLRSIPVAGPVIADLLQPSLRVLVNLGYGDPEYGWVNENADVPTPAGLFPSLDDLEKVPGLLVSGAIEGIQKAISDLANPSELFSLENNPVLNLLETLPSRELISNIISFPPPTDTLQGVVNAFSEAASNLYGTVVPVADIVNALITTLPAENIDLFTYWLDQGDLVAAIGYPLMANVTLIPLAGLIALATVGEGALIAALDLVSPFVDVASLFP